MKKEIIIKFQKALVQKKTLHARKKEKKAQSQRVLPLMIKEKITAKQGLNKSGLKMQKVLEELKEETRPKISWKKAKDKDVGSLAKGKINVLTVGYSSKQNKMQIFDQVTKEA